jgi:hypothetical protein
LETHLVLGFGSETICPSREIGETIPVFHLQVVGIVIQGDLSEKDFIFSFGEEKAFSLARVEGLGVSLGWAHSSFSGWACFH